MTKFKDINILVDSLIKNQPKLVTYDLKRLRLVLQRLGSPQLILKNIIHVAGTNGKGSTIANLKALLIGHGYSVNTFTSPHLLEVRERININGQDIADDFLFDLLNHIINNSHDIPLSFFELITCAGFLAFKEYQADYTLIEVGLGGKKDATNIISSPIASLITPISLDHQEFLGDSISKISLEKSGIIKKQVPLFIGKQPKQALDVIKNTAAKLDCLVFEYGKDWSVTYSSDRPYVKLKDKIIELDSKTLAGTFQSENSALALATLFYLDLLKFEISKRCLANVKWPGRFQYLNHGPLIDIIKRENDKSKLIIDGAHNASGAGVIAEEISKNHWTNTCLILAIQKSKDVVSFMEKFKGLVKSVFIIDSLEDNFQSHAEIVKQVGHAEFNIQKKQYASEAVGEIINKNKGEPVTIIITGSLYFIGKILEKHS